MSGTYLKDLDLERANHGATPCTVERRNEDTARSDGSKGGTPSSRRPCSPCLWNFVWPCKRQSWRMRQSAVIPTECAIGPFIVEERTVERVVHVTRKRYTTFVAVFFFLLSALLYLVIVDFFLCYHPCVPGLYLRNTPSADVHEYLKTEDLPVTPFRCLANLLCTCHPTCVRFVVLLAIQDLLLLS